MTSSQTTHSPVRIARAALTALFDPSDGLAQKLVLDLGAHAAYQIAIGAQPVHAFADVSANELADGVRRWETKIHDLKPEKDLAAIERLGGGFLIPGDEHWPAALNDLPDTPYGLWYLGDIGNGIPGPEKSVALIGSRDSTGYGLAVTSDMAGGLVRAGYSVVSDLSYGVASMAHRAALTAGNDLAPATIAVVAGGADRAYPSGNADLADAIRGRGLILSEQPPGTGVTRQRFLQRNRIVAALAGVTCVTEARYRGSALGTARIAAAIGRTVAAVPGSVYSAQSAGVHQLFKEGGARLGTRLVTDTGDVLDLLAAYEASQQD